MTIKVTEDSIGEITKINYKPLKTTVIKNPIGKRIIKTKITKEKNKLK